MECEHSEDSIDNIEEDKTYLSLTSNEIEYIDDNLSLIVEKPPGSPIFPTIRPLKSKASVPGTMDLIEQIGHALLYITDPLNLNKEAKISVSYMDLFILRECTDSSAYYKGEPVGSNLKIKIYRLLYEESYRERKAARDIISNLDETTLSKIDAIE